MLLRISFKANNAAYFTNNAWKLCVVFWAGASGLVWREDKVCHDEESAVLCRRDDVIRLVPNPLVHPPHLRTRVETTRVRRQPWPETRQKRFAKQQRSNIALATVVSYQNEIFSSKWELPPLLSPSFITQGRMEARRAALILMKTLILIGHHSKYSVISMMISKITVAKYA